MARMNVGKARWVLLVCAVAVVLGLVWVLIRGAQLPPVKPVEVARQVEEQPSEATAATVVEGEFRGHHT